MNNFVFHLKFKASLILSFFENFKRQFFLNILEKFLINEIRVEKNPLILLKQPCMKKKLFLNFFLIMKKK